MSAAASPGYVTVFPCGSPRPLAASLNHDADQTISNAVTARIGVGGAVCIFTYATTDIVVDVNAAYATGSELRPLVPSRLIDTRADVEKKVASENGLGAFVPSYRAVRTARWKYVEWYGGTDHDYELYDLRADPYELENLLATPEGATEHASTTARLQSRLEALAACAGATCH